MTERKTTPKPLAIFRRLDAGNVPAPWVPPEVPATAARGRAVAKVDRTKSTPAPWVPAELPASMTAPAVKTDDRKLGKLKPWVPPADAPRNLSAAVSNNLPAVPADEGGSLVEPQKRNKKGARRKGELTSETVHHDGQTTINIVNQVAAPAPVVYGPWWGWWGGYGCLNFSCPRRAGRSCWRLWCGWW
jgi:hypothetical protein